MNPDFKWHTQKEKKEVVRYWWQQQEARCHLCGDPMEPCPDDPNSPNAPSVEHLIPKRENGSDTVGNVRLAHRACNNALGALWEINRDRKARGLDPLSEKWALNNERAKHRGLGHVKFRTTTKPEVTWLEEARTHPEKQTKKAKGCSWSLAKLIERGEYPMPRGATLP